MSSSDSNGLLIEPTLANQPKTTSTSINSMLHTVKSSFTKFVVIKLCVVCVLITLMAVITMCGLGLPTSMHGECIIDLGFKITNAANKLFQESQVFRHTYLITAGLVIDFIFFYVCIFWALFSKSWRLLITLALFYGIRGTFQSLYQMSFPAGFTWEYPGFPSLVCSYLKTNDFFYSGHCGMPMICFMEFRAEKKMIISYFCLFAIIFEGFLVLISRSHYSIDIIIGIAFAQYLFIIIDSFCNWFYDKYCKKPLDSQVIDSAIEKLEPIANANTTDVKLNVNVNAKGNSNSNSNANVNVNTSDTNDNIKKNSAMKELI